jgi:hypothetical protein
MAGRAEAELRLVGWLGAEVDEFEANIGWCALRLVRAFARQEHSGTSAEITLELFVRLVRGEALGPLTYAEDEWTDCSAESGYPLWQNIRDVRVFRHGPGELAWSVGDGPAPRHDSKGCRWCGGGRAGAGAR